jgi:hypothetical protein
VPRSFTAKPNKKPAVILSLGILASLLYGVSPIPMLRIEAEDRLILGSIWVPDGFRISFIHSINLSLVDEYFSIGPGGAIILERMVFDQFSTGMPSGGEDGFVVEDGRYATYPGRTMKEIALRVSPLSGHTMTYRGITVALTRWAETGALLRLSGLNRRSDTYRAK